MIARLTTRKAHKWLENKFVVEGFERTQVRAQVKAAKGTTIVYHMVGYDYVHPKPFKLFFGENVFFHGEPAPLPVSRFRLDVSSMVRPVRVH